MGKEFGCSDKLNTLIVLTSYLSSHCPLLGSLSSLPVDGSHLSVHPTPVDILVVTFIWFAASLTEERVPSHALSKVTTCARKCVSVKSL